MPRARKATPRPTAVLEAEAGRTKKIAGFSLQELETKLTPYVDGSIETLGKAALEGDKTAAKTVLEFLTEIARDGRGTENNEVLDRIAEIRRGAS